MERFIHRPTRLTVLLTLAIVSFTTATYCQSSPSRTDVSGTGKLPLCNFTTHRPACIDCPDFYGYAGFAFEPGEDGHFTVTKVFQKTPAEIAGLKKGDEICGLEMLTGRTRPRVDTISLIQGNPHGMALLKVRRQKEDIQITLQISCLKQYPNSALLKHLRRQSYLQLGYHPKIAGHVHSE